MHLSLKVHLTPIFPIAMQRLSLKKELNNLLGKAVVNEIALFRAMQKAIHKYFSCTLIEETHQHYVSFKSQSTGFVLKREISDLWIIVFSPKAKYARMTFLQAKFDRKAQNSGNLFSFNGDYFQYELLANRPQVNSVSRFKFPSDILAFSSFDTIGTFGVFYRDQLGKIDMAYCAASDLSVKTLVNKKNQCKRQLYFPHLGKGCLILKTQNQKIIELSSSLDIDCFLVGLINMIVGAEIQNNQSIQIFLKQFFKQFSTRPVVKQFLNFLDLLNDTEIDLSNNGVNGNILLINVDEEIG